MNSSIFFAGGLAGPGALRRADAVASVIAVGVTVGADALAVGITLVSVDSGMTVGATGSVVVTGAVGVADAGLAAGEDPARPK